MTKEQRGYATLISFVIVTMLFALGVKIGSIL